MESVSQGETVKMSESDMQTPPEELHSVRHGFAVANYRLMVPKGIFSEYISASKLCHMPGTPSWFLGFINHRGETIPVFDLEAVFSPDASNAAAIKGFLLLDSFPLTIAIALRQSPQVLINPVSRSMNNIQPEIQPFVVGSYVVKDDMWFDLDHHRLFSDLRARF